MKTATRRAGWILLLAAAALAAALAPPLADDELTLSPRSQRAAARGDGAAAGTEAAHRDTTEKRRRPGEPEVLSIRPRMGTGDGGETTPLFDPTRWTPALATAPVAASAPAIAARPVLSPQAPALPFRVIGRYDDGDVPAVFLQLNDRILVVHVGDVVDMLYKVERLDERTLTLRYLPLNQLQSLEMGGPS